MKKFLLAMFSLLFLFSCEKEKNDFYVYKIKEGKHKTIARHFTARTDDFKFTAIFDSSAIYQTQDPVNQLDINKLYGFSDCNSHHQKNSARFGWRWYNNSLQILAYVYNDGERKFEYITSVPLNQEVSYEIVVTDDSYEFYVGSEHVSMIRTAKCDVGFKYMLYPYFGGDETAPHDITILIRDS